MLRLLFFLMLCNISLFLYNTMQSRLASNSWSSCFSFLSACDYRHVSPCLSIYHFFTAKTFKIFSSSYLKHRVCYCLIWSLYQATAPPNFLLLSNCNLYSIPSSPHLCSQAFGNNHSTRNFFKAIKLFRFHLWVRPCDISVSGLCHST
jgi:hypothetical protein